MVVDGGCARADDGNSSLAQANDDGGRPVLVEQTTGAA